MSKNVLYSFARSILGQGKAFLCFLSVLGIVLGMAGCTSPEPMSSYAPDSSSAAASSSSSQPEPPPTPVWEKPTIVQPQTKLQNAAAAGILPCGATLDALLSQSLEKGVVVRNVLFPTTWPLEWTADYIPQYPGNGQMLLTRICSLKQDDPTSAMSAGITVYGYQAAELSDYYSLLLESGYKETLDPPTEQDMQFMPSPNLLFHKFVRQDAAVLIITGTDNTGDYFNLVLTMTDRMEPHQAAWEKARAKRIAATGTALQNAAQAGMLPDGESMDKLIDERNSSTPGVTTRVTAFPTAWPTSEVSGCLPLYPGDGWIGQKIISSPDHAVPNAAHSVTVVIYHYDPQQLMEYFTGLLSSGFVSSDDFRELDGKLPPGSSMSFKAEGDGVVIYLTQSSDTYGPYVDINVLMEERLLTWVAAQKGTEMGDQLLKWAQEQLATDVA